MPVRHRNFWYSHKLELGKYLAIFWLKLPRRYVALVLIGLFSVIQDRYRSFRSDSATAPVAMTPVCQSDQTP